LTGKDESEKDDDNKTALERLKDQNKGVVKCRICKEDHWTTMCPYKETLGPLQESLAKGTGEGALEDDKSAGGTAASRDTSERAPAGGAVSSAGKYVPPSKRDGAKTGDAMPDRRRSKFRFVLKYEFKA
jgi:translation initiation factor 3 subunit G